MKRKFYYLNIILLLLFTCCFSSACSIDDNDYQDYVQALDYSESIATIHNPDQGFYSAACVQVGQNTIADRTYIINNNYQLYHLRMDISEFSGVVNGEGDIPLTTTALQNIDDMLKVYKNKEKNVIIRFAYDKNFAGTKNQEPSTEIMITHIKQLCPVLNKYSDTLTAVEVGMVGPWGEMHSSQAANAQTISLLVDTFLNNTQTIPILVRTPKMIYNYLGITINDIDSTTIGNNDKAYRLGLFNDGYLGSSSDLGTYTNREKEVAWISQQTEHLPFGGEVTVPSSSLHDIETCLPEMYQINLSYLNYAWNDTVVQNKWKNSYYTKDCGTDNLYYGQSAFTYIQNHFGYRLVLERSVFNYSSSFKDLNISLKIKNVGFGNLNRTKNLTLYFVDKNNNVSSVNIGTYDGQNEINLSTNLNLENGEYNVYLSVNTLIDDVPAYEIQFANNLWNNELSANLIGNININKQ